MKLSARLLAPMLLLALGPLTSCREEPVPPGDVDARPPEKTCVQRQRDWVRAIVPDGEAGAETVLRAILEDRDRLSGMPYCSPEDTEMEGTLP